MKKITLILLLLISITTLAACAEKVEIPDFYGKEYGEAIIWGADNDINISITSVYNDDVLPETIISQSIEAGTIVELETEMDVVYSRGYDPNAEVVIPDFASYSSEADITSWLLENDIKNFSFKRAFSPDFSEGEYVRYENINYDDRTTELRKDQYKFYFSGGNLEVEEVEFNNRSAVRGVNLGGWFVLESWMTPDLFAGVTDAHDETTFMQNKENAMAVMENHYNTFITEEDFIWLSETGVDYIRLPIPWWLWGVENAYEGTELEVDYAPSIFYIERAMTWAEKYDIGVLLDLHTAPGCQNGFDNGGISGVQEWGKNESTTHYVQQTVDILERIAQHFSSYDSLWGIEVLNEPGWGVDMGVLQQFYKDAYVAIRKHNYNVWVGFHDGFRSYDENAWRPFFTNNSFHNVFFDLHLYQIFGDHWSDFDIYEHLEWVEVEQTKAVHRYDDLDINIIVGEWSLGLQGNVYNELDSASIKMLKTAFGNAQFNVYEQGMGWFFWNYKIDQSSHLEWDFRRLVEAGLIPEYFSTKR